MSASNPFKDLESNDSQIVDEFKCRYKEQFNATKETWVLNLIYDYYLATDSLRAVDVIVAIKEPHDKYFFDRSWEGVRSNNKLPHLTLLGYVVRKRPIWLFGISEHPLFKELIRLLKTETDIVTLVSALLIINILLPIIPALLAPHLQDMFVAFSKLAAVNTNNTNSNYYHEAQLVHLQISLYTLFHRLYGMFPCNFLTYLRKTYSPSQSSFPVFSHTVKPMLDTVRVNPLLISATDSWEIQPDRWKNVEPHDVIISCAKLLMNGNPPTEPNISMHEPKSSFSFKDILEGLKVTGKKTVADYCNELSKKSGDAALWSPSVRHLNSMQLIESTPTRIPSTPITRAFEVSSPYSDHEGSSPPEAAIEATPESTPIRSYTVPMTDRSYPSSPIKKEVLSFRKSAPEIKPNFTLSSSSKVNQLINDRQQVTSDESVIELKPVGPAKNDLSHHRSPENYFMLAGEKVSSPPPECSLNNALADEKPSNGSFAHLDQVVSDRVENFMKGTRVDNMVDHDVNIVHAVSVDDFEGCVIENSESPCSSGGLHMPDSRSLHNFVKEIRRIRHHSQCHSESGNFSTGTSPQDIPGSFNDAKVRRTHSCPEIKKNSPSTIFASTSLNKPPRQPVPEENEDNDDTIVSSSEMETNGNDTSVNAVAVTETKYEKICSSSQTEDIQPLHFPYEHLFLDVFPPLHPTCSADHISPTESENSFEEKSTIYEKVCSPSKILQKFIEAAIQCHTDKMSKSAFQPYDAKFLANQLKLMSIQLQFEEHRREIHAERNRRLLGRSRRNKTLEEYNNALKDQVSLLQLELEKSSADMSKLVTQKELQIEHEQKAGAYYREKFEKLQTDYKDISDKCQEIEAQLRDERKINTYNTKMINESKASLIDVTNELKTCQKEAKTARELRTTVARLQAEILKAGEMIIRLRRRLIDFAGITSGEAQEELKNAARTEELKKLKHSLEIQSTSLDVTNNLIDHLRNELEDRENIIEELKNDFGESRKKQEIELRELKQKYEKLKKSYYDTVDRTKELEYKLDRAKCVSKFVTPVETKSIIESGDIRRSTRRPTNRSEETVDKSKLRFDEVGSIFHSSAENNASDSSPTKIKSQPKNVASSVAVLDNGASSQSIGVVGDTATSNPDLNLPTTKKKGRKECAESGQLKSMSTTSDLETPFPCQKRSSQ
ncbi:hypothetical protein V9T40_010554 [Parthenolecanium corni]|uniref:Hamartin n=1 Tax=Parthenolecanium corni TaxID=536013 RepID=A0AAN9T7L9_9HEMI